MHKYNQLFSVEHIFGVAVCAGRETLTLTYLTEQANSPFQWGNKILTEPKTYIQ